MTAGEQPIEIASDPAHLHGTLLLPPGGKRGLIAALILAGSGPVNRDGNTPGARTDGLRLLARGLAARGIATLRVDKRGVGESRAAGPREEDLRFGTYVADAVHWLDGLRSVPRVGRIAAVGHSEGALVATLAAQQRPDLAALVVVAGAGVPAGIILRRQLRAAGLPRSLWNAADRALAALERGRPVAEPPAGLEALFRPSVQPYLTSWLALDPAAEFARVRPPALVVQGTTDLQVMPGDARRLAAARPGVEFALIEGMNHVLKHAPLERAANLAAYADPDRPLVPELLNTIAAFLTRVAGAAP